MHEFGFWTYEDEVVVEGIQARNGRLQILQPECVPNRIYFRIQQAKLPQGAPLGLVYLNALPSTGLNRKLRLEIPLWYPARRFQVTLGRRWLFTGPSRLNQLHYEP